MVHDELHVLNVATAPEHRRRGVARAVMEAVLDARPAAPVHPGHAGGAPEQRGGPGALPVLGFRPVGIRPNYYVDEGEDAIVMVLDF